MLLVRRKRVRGGIHYHSRFLTQERIQTIILRNKNFCIVKKLPQRQMIWMCKRTISSLYSVLLLCQMEFLSFDHFYRKELVVKRSQSSSSSSSSSWRSKRWTDQNYYITADKKHAHFSLLLLHNLLVCFFVDFCTGHRLFYFPQDHVKMLIVSLEENHPKQWKANNG